MFSGTIRFAAALFVVVTVGASAQQSAPPKVAIPEFPGGTTSTPSTSRSTPSPNAVDDPATASPGKAPLPQRPLSKAEEKEKRRRDKEMAKQQKDAETERSYLKLQGEDIVAPTLDADGNPVKLQQCSKKDKACIKKRKEILHRKKIGMKIENGTLTVDGWTGKARLNYDISEVKFLYIYSPGIGTVIVSNQHFPNSMEQKNALNGKTLTATTPDGHMIQLTSDKVLVDKKSQSVFVATDAAYTLPVKYPTLGYGSIARAPYNWPGARPLSEQQKKQESKVPPLPKGMEARPMTLPCQKVAPGQLPTPVKINGVMMTPPACPPVVTAISLAPTTK